jgi:hypothetical protein
MMDEGGLKPAPTKRSRLPVRASIVGIVLFGGAVLLCSAARAQEPAAQHLGVQLRAVVGPAYLTATQSLPGGGDDPVDGFGAGFNVALGAMIGEQLALDMDLVLVRSTDAEHGVLEDTTFSALHLGGGLTYWLMPANVYLAASLGLARSSVAGNPVRLGVELPTGDASDLGAGLHLAAGKQWWLSRRVGLGATLSLLGSVANNPVAGHDSPRLLFGAVLGFTASLH